VLRAGASLSAARAAVLMVHGRGAGPANILDLVPALLQPGIAYLAPGAAGGTWYPQSFLAPIADNEPGITSGIAVIHALVDEVLAAGIPAERIVLLGFSQGACLVATAVSSRSPAASSARPARAGKRRATSPPRRCSSAAATATRMCPNRACARRRRCSSAWARR
jgi:predicted esterase